MLVRGLAAVTMLLLFQVTEGQNCILPVSMDKRIDKASIIVEGTVVDKYSSWDKKRESIYTVQTIEVVNLLKGNWFKNTLKIVTRGGRVGDLLQIDHPSLHLNLGETGLFLVEPSSVEVLTGDISEPLFKCVYSLLGYLKYDLAHGTASDALVKYGSIQREIYIPIQKAGIDLSKGMANRPVKPVQHRSITISSFSPTTVTAGTETTLTISGAGFGATQGSGKVEYANADNGGASFIEPLTSDYIAWSDTQIQLKVPSGAGSGDIRVTNNNGEEGISSNTLYVDYNITNLESSGDAYFANLVDADGSGGLSFQFQEDFYNDNGAYSAFIRAFDTWRCSNGNGSGINWVDGGSTSIDLNARDDVNIVRFDNNELSSNVLGRTTSYYSGCYLPDLQWYLAEVDIVFNESPYTTNYSWNFDETDNSTAGNEFDFESVAVHELGHAHQLGHVNNFGNIMYFSISNGSEYRELQSSDLAAANEAITLSQNVCDKDVISSDFFCLTLPLEVLDLRGESIGEDGILVSMELQTGYLIQRLELEKSKDGKHFSTIHAWMQPMEYLISREFFDKEVLANNFYRLKITDYDGQINYSGVMQVSVGFADSDQIFYPNPVTDQLFFTESLINSLEKVTIRDLNGQSLKAIGKPIDLMIDVNDLLPGTYILEFVTRSGIRSELLFRQ